MNGIGDAGAAHTTSARAATAFKFVVLDATEVSVERARLAPAGVQVACCGAKDGEGRDVSDAQLCGATAIGVWHTVWIGGALLARLPASVKLIVRFGVGFDNVDVRGCGARGIRVHNVPNYGTEEVADAALSHILNLYRSTHALAMAVAHGAVIKGPDAIAAHSARSCGAGGARRIRGQVLGLVGMGRIGTATLLRAKAFGFHCVFYDPYVCAGLDKALGAERCSSLGQLLERADCVTLHCNCTEENTRMLGRDQFAKMKRGSFLVNTARGELVDDAALGDALRSGKLAAASLDVHWDEPFTVPGHALAQAGVPNLVCTPHCAWYSKESRLEMREIACGYVLDLIRGVKSPSCVNEAFLVEGGGGGGSGGGGGGCGGGGGSGGGGG